MCVCVCMYASLHERAHTCTDLRKVNIRNLLSNLFFEAESLSQVQKPPPWLMYPANYLWGFLYYVPTLPMLKFDFFFFLSKAKAVPSIKLRKASVENSEAFIECLSQLVLVQMCVHILPSVETRDVNRIQYFLLMALIWRHLRCL